MAIHQDLYFPYQIRNQKKTASKKKNCQKRYSKKRIVYKLLNSA